MDAFPSGVDSSWEIVYQMGEKKWIIFFSPGIEGDVSHVHVVDRGENVGSALNDALAGFRHGHRRAGGDQHRLIPRTQRQVRHEMTLHKDHL